MGRPLRLIYRADGGHPIGTGHIWRAARIMRALAARVDLDARLLFAEDPFARKVAEAAPVRPIALPPRQDLQAVKPLLDAGPVLDEISRETCDLIAIDMLDTPEADMAALRATGIPLLTFDDRGPGRFHADTIINVLVEEPDRKSLRPEIQLLEGGSYVALDYMFNSVYPKLPVREFGPLRNVFVAMGGADAVGLTVKVAKALGRIKHLGEVQFVCGPAFPHKAELIQALDGAPWKYEILTNLPGLLQSYIWCDLAIVAGGLTMYEVCCTGTPSLAVCQPIDHQFELAERLSHAGAIATAGWGLEANEEQIADAVTALSNPTVRQQMSMAGPKLVDGRGTERIADAILETASFSHEIIRQGIR
jgi:spore coat polysaccharide biosynthesis predicted glycosyltransferase SpsG